MKQSTKLTLCSLAIVFFIVTFSNLCFAGAYVHVKLENGTSYDFIGSTFSTGWNSDNCQDMLCEDQNYSVNNVKFANVSNWGALCSNSDWLFSMMLLEVRMPEVFYQSSTNAVSGTLVGTTTQLSIPYGDIDKISFRNTDCGSTWNQLSLTPGYLSDVYFKENISSGVRFVAVGSNGLIITSSDGLTWTNRTSGTTSFIKSVTSGSYSSPFVTVGYSGLVLTSTDGITWTSRNSSTTNNLRGITYGNGLYLAVGDNGTIITSSDGTTWTVRNSGVTKRLNDVTYGNGLYVVVGADGLILTSSDLTTWTSRNSYGSEYLQGVTYGNGTYVIAGTYGKILTSTNGTSWTVRNSGITTHLYSVTYNLDSNINGSNDSPVFVAAGYLGKVLTSNDGTTWSAYQAPSTEHINAVTYGYGKFIAVGQDLIETSSCR